MTAKVRLFRIAATAAQEERPRLILQRFSTAIAVKRIQEWPSKEEGAKRKRAWPARNPSGLVVFSDGSKMERDTTGYGFAVFRSDRLIDKGYG